MAIYVFRSMDHYSWFSAQINFNKTLVSDNGRKFEAPRQFMVKVLEIDWSFYQRKMGDWKGKDTVSCPFCFWNRRRLVYITPMKKIVTISETETKHFQVERLALCPCRLYDSDYVDVQGKRGEDREWVMDHRANFAHLKIDWDIWCRKIRSHESFMPRSSQPDMMTANMDADEDIYKPVF